MAGVAGAGPVTGAPRPVHVVSRWQVSRLADLGAVCPDGHPAFPAFSGQWLKGDLSGHGRGGGCASGLLGSRPCRIPFSPVVDRHQRFLQCVIGHPVVKHAGGYYGGCKRTPSGKTKKNEAVHYRIMALTDAAKGKSSAAFGLIVRSIAHGLPCAIIQFIKGTWMNGEIDDRSHEAV